MWVKDILGDAYEARTLPLPDDEHGELVATLVRRRAGQSTRAVLYVHGYNDYFFQTHLADFFVSLGYTFYALDLRRSGRSLRPGQTPSMVDSVSEYFTELDEAARIIREEDGHDILVVNAHSTGGLTTSLWAHKLQGTGIITALTLNSPFFDLNANWFLRRVAPVVLAPVGRRQPMRVVPAGLSTVYGDSLHIDRKGSWRFDTAWKPLEGIPTRLGWLVAITHAQRRLRKGLNIDIPVLVTASTASYKSPEWSDDATRMDAVLDVEHIAEFARALGPDVTFIEVPDGLHDLALSAEEARQLYFDTLQEWLNAHVG
ncbi:alpha/beta hydrolase [Longispora fulva]|uniref:Alpha-beta hydrolase superfamily lysophospholipase n=1 Tax=Longispora fulva TaxID=619741 RepID=A0A8J7GMR3_9ACTN|nr:alpha/beta hydrolase [Longispora fulva]MBG6140650.1 alpha-beta hydrolase superfamily lysophospholipase [Longispora fulva]GIG56966.1 alpha/beta hydrolase [Longispora fulva]